MTRAIPDRHLATLNCTNEISREVRLDVDQSFLEHFWFSLLRFLGAAGVAGK